MIQKQEDKVRNGTHLQHHVRKKVRMSKSKIKSMLICFFESRDFPYRIWDSRTNC